MLDDLQAKPIDKLPVEEEWVTVPSSFGDARVRVIKPVGAKGMLPAIVYMHGGGWVLGNAGTHDRLVRELAVGSNAGLAFVEYPNSPEARFPVAIEQGYATAQWITREGSSKGLDPSRIAVIGEPVGGNMAAALTLMAKERGDVQFVRKSRYERERVNILVNARVVDGPTAASNSSSQREDLRVRSPGGALLAPREQQEYALALVPVLVMQNWKSGAPAVL